MAKKENTRSQYGKKRKGKMKKGGKNCKNPSGQAKKAANKSYHKKTEKKRLKNQEYVGLKQRSAFFPKETKPKPGTASKDPANQRPL